MVKLVFCVFCRSCFRIRILLSLFFFCHDLWRCVSVPINFQATFGSSQALRQVPGLNSAGKRSASSLSICAADVLINISCCLLDLSSELHNSRSGPSTLSLPRSTEVKGLHLKTSSSIQIRKCENAWVQIVAMFLSQTVTVLGLPSLRQQLKKLEEQREQRRPEVEVNMGPGCGEMLNSEWLGFWFQFTSTDLNTQKTFNDFIVKRTGCVKDSKLRLQRCRTSKHKLKFSTKMLSCERCGFQDVPVWKFGRWMRLVIQNLAPQNRGEVLQSITNEDVNF